MWISKLHVKGYRAFSDTGELKFGPGLNLIIGQNNSGKSSLISALGHHFNGSKHKSEAEYRDFALPEPTMQIVLHCEGEEIRNAILASGQHFSFHFIDGKSDVNAALNAFENLDTVNIQLTKARSSGFKQSAAPMLPFFGPNTSNFTMMVSGNGGKLRVTGIHTGQGENINSIFDYMWSANTFHFGAQRYSIGSYAFSREERLTSNASNLPSVLAALQGDRGDIFSKLVGHLTEIFDNIGNMSIATTGDGFQVRTWPTSSMTASELGFSLDDSGTGVSQVIAILLVAMTMKQSVIVIDEISSFLHPAAAKSLLRILQTNYSEHQYIITTHSPEVIASSIVASVKLVKRKGYVSEVQSIDLTKISDLRDVCAHIGVTMSDVFAADRVIWVEGQTEELLFPYIYSNLYGSIPKGTVVTAVVATGDFATRRKRDREMAFAVYRRLTEVANPLIEASIFSFDRENLTSQDLEDLQSRSGGRIKFLPRRNLECYLVNSDAIAEVMNDLLSDSATAVSSSQIGEWLHEKGGHTLYGAQAEWNGDLNNEAWLVKVDGARLLKDAFSSISNGLVEFSKTRDDAKIVQKLLNSNRVFLVPLSEFVKELYEGVK